MCRWFHFRELHIARCQWLKLLCMQKRLIIVHQGCSKAFMKPMWRPRPTQGCRAEDDADDEASTYKRQVHIPQKNHSLVTLEKVEKCQVCVGGTYLGILYQCQITLCSLKICQ